MKDGHWILDKNGNPMPADLITWAKWIENRSGDRIVKQENVGDLMVSTVFLGLDHNFGDGPPILWETMVFGKEVTTKIMGKTLKSRETVEINRCSGNREQAEAMHHDMVERMQAMQLLTVDDV